MPYRTFEDSVGKEWQVWDIVPRLTERRVEGEDRRAEITPIAFADRRRDERRLAHTRRTVLRGSYAEGWLCFDNGFDKRRLTPIPTDWTTCGEEEIESYLRDAEPVRSSGSHVNFSSEAPLAETG